MDYIHDLIHAGVTVAGLSVAVAVLKRDMKWLIEAFRSHEELDNRRFDSVDKDVRELRKNVRAARMEH